MKTAEEYINRIQIQPSNLMHIAETKIINGTLLIEVKKAMEEYASQFKSEQQESEWIPVDIAIPAKNGKVKTYDNDSLTPEKELTFEDGKFLYESHGQRLDYTNHITKWQPLPKTPKK